MAESNTNAPAQDSPLEQRYLAYLAAINAKDWPLVATFAQPQLIHNGNHYSNTEYANMIDKTSGVFPGIVFVAERLVCDEQKGDVACRIRFDFENGRESFYEHIFYSFKDGKISQAWTMIDTPKA